MFMQESAHEKGSSQMRRNCGQAGQQLQWVGALLGTGKSQGIGHRQKANRWAACIKTKALTKEWACSRACLACCSPSSAFSASTRLAAAAAASCSCCWAAAMASRKAAFSCTGRLTPFAYLIARASVTCWPCCLCLQALYIKEAAGITTHHSTFNAKPDTDFDVSQPPNAPRRLSDVCLT